MERIDMTAMKKMEKNDTVLNLYAEGVSQSDIAQRVQRTLSYVSKIVSQARDLNDERADKGDAIWKRPAQRTKDCSYATCKELGIEVTYWRLSQYSDKTISLPRVSILEKDLPG